MYKGKRQASSSRFPNRFQLPILNGVAAIRARYAERVGVSIVSD
jgi:hypothetical protein